MNGLIKTIKGMYIAENYSANTNAPCDEGGDASKQADKKKKFADALSDANKTATGAGEKETIKKQGVSEEVEQVDETIIHADKEYDIMEKSYDAYFKKKLAGTGKSLRDMNDDEKKMFFKNVDSGYKAKNEETFVEAFMASDLADVKNAHKKSGNRISDEKSGTKEGKAFHSFVVTTPEGKRTRHIYHGTSKKLETMSPAKKSKESSEQDLDDK